MKHAGLAFVLLAAGVALGMMWGVRLSPGLVAPRETEVALALRPGVTLLVLLCCVSAAFARTLRHGVAILVALGVTQLVVSIAYAVLVWVPHSAFHRPPVG